MTCKRINCNNPVVTGIYCSTTCYDIDHGIDTTKCLQCHYPIGNAQEQWAEAGVCSQPCYNRYYSTRKTDADNNIIVTGKCESCGSIEHATGSIVCNQFHKGPVVMPAETRICVVCTRTLSGLILKMEWDKLNVCCLSCYERLGFETVAQELAQGVGTRSDKDKSRVDLIPADALLELGELYRLGAAKYNAHNWERGMAYSRMYGSMVRHMLKFWGGEEIDPDGFHHLTAVAFGALGLLHYELDPESYKEFDDRWFGPHQQPMEEPDRRSPDRRKVDWDIDIPERRTGSERRVTNYTADAKEPIWARRTGNERRKQNG